MCDFASFFQLLGFADIELLRVLCAPLVYNTGNVAGVVRMLHTRVLLMFGSAVIGGKVWTEGAEHTSLRVSSVEQ